VHAPALDVKAALENLPSINVASVSTTRNGWRITFESEAGDLPLMQVTTGRITGFAHISVSVEEVAKGTATRLLFDGSDKPDNCIFTATELTTDAGYAFKVAPVNAIGDDLFIISLSIKEHETDLSHSEINGETASS